MKTTNWDAVITSAPLDKQASIVRDGRSAGEPVTINNSYAEQPPTRPYMDVPANNLTGQRFGKVVALGLGESARKGTTPWVVKCDCGRFARMKAKVLRTSDPARLACGECDYLYQVRMGLKKTDPERVLLRHDKAPSDGQFECNAAVFPHLEVILRKAIADGFDVDVALRAMTQFIQREKAKARPQETDAARKPASTDTSINMESCAPATPQN